MTCHMLSYYLSEVWLGCFGHIHSLATETQYHDGHDNPRLSGL